MLKIKQEEWRKCEKRFVDK